MLILFATDYLSLKVDLEVKNMPGIMSSSTDIHVEHRGFLGGECPISDAYLQP